jgi:hypothetical protein
MQRTCQDRSNLDLQYIYHSQEWLPSGISQAVCIVRGTRPRVPENPRKSHVSRSVRSCAAPRCLPLNPLLASRRVT